MKTSTQAYQQSLQPNEVLELLKAGNKRFTTNKPSKRNLLEQMHETSSGQYPFATILSCIDSRAPAEYIFDQGLGDIFNIRIAGNIVNDDILGSMEFSCNVAGSKLIMVLGHTDCGAIKGACGHVELGNLTGLLKKINPSIQQLQTKQPNHAIMDDITKLHHVTTHNIHHSIDEIRCKSSILKSMEDNHEIMIIGGLYDVSTGNVLFLD